MARKKDAGDESTVYRQLAGPGLTAGDVGNASFSKNIEKPTQRSSPTRDQ